VTQDDPRREAHERALSELYRTTRRETPSEALDAALLAQARRQAAARRRRWMLPLSSAAVVLLGVSLVVKLNLLAPPPILPGSPAIDEQPQSVRERQPESVSVPAPTTSSGAGTLPRLHEEQRSAPAKLQRAMPPRPVTSADEEGIDSAPTRMKAASKAEADAALSELAKQPWREDADQWVSYMLKLLATGREADARQELALFRQQYGDYDLPPPLKQLEGRGD
jgi:hypothetical protein